MTIERLRCFVSAAAHLNFTRAAQERHMAQTAMSRQIATLEDELGCRLFYRDNRTVALTPTGEKFYRDISAVLSGYDEAVQDARQAGQAVEGGLRIGIGQYEGSFVSELVQEFCHMYPLVEVTISQHRYQELIDYLLRGLLDVAFALPVSAEYLDGQPVEILNLFTAEVGIVLPKNHPLSGTENPPLDYLAQECLITLSEEDGPASIQRLHKKLEESGLKSKNIRQANSLNSELLMVEAGAGFALLPRFLARDLSDKLVMLPAVLPYPGKDQFVAISREDRRSPCLEVFLQGIATSRTLAEWVRRQKADAE